MAVEAGSATMSERTAPDRFMRRLLLVPESPSPDSRTVGEAHRAFRISLIVSGVRCLFSYVLIPVLVPLLSFAGVLAAPVGIALCVIAVVNGIVSLRRFWVSNHRSRWMYTWFMVVVFAVLAVALFSDIARLVA
ncbi:MAG TPA: hypothetical protein PKE40_10790 [Arachnia sp.]|nr:hypothetical protein [Arachnia sp.]HMT86830.1 hypothetical protein [Arachnia sp.]